MRDHPDEERRDLVVDVVIAGCGFAGAVTAIAAHDQGLVPLVLEKMPHPGGISITSGGGLAVARDEEGCFQYLRRTCLNTTPDPVLRAMAQGMVELPAYVRFLETRSTERVADQRAEAEHGAHATYDFPGAATLAAMELAKSQGFQAFPWARGLRGGARLFKLLLDNLAARGVLVHCQMVVTGLLRGPDGAIAGVVAQPATPATATTRPVRVLARRGVVLATGGFEFAEDIKRQFFWGQPVYGVTGLGNTGDGIRLAQAAGADLWHMWHFHGGYGFKFPEFPCAFRHRIGGPRTPNRQMPWILLDKHGRRYMNEYPPAVQDTAARDMLAYDADLTEYPRIPSVMLLDEPGLQSGPLALPISQGEGYAYQWSANNLQEVARGWVHRAENRADLAAQLQVPAENLARTLDRWNQGCAAGADPDFGRLPGTMRPIAQPPFYWVHVWPVVNNTQGGPVHDEHQRIIDALGRPIPRLYAAGELGSLFGHLYLEAGNVSECLISGRIAAAHLATLEPRTPAADTEEIAVANRK